jgi:ATP adenylyltransferase
MQQEEQDASEQPDASGGPDTPEEHIGEVGRDGRHDQPGVAVDRLQRMWAPWRYGYVAGDSPIEGCPFCVLPARDPSEDRRSLIVFRGTHAYVIFNAYPYNPGHLMVVPYAHVAELDELDAAVADEVWALGRRAVTVLKSELDAQGTNLGMNLGAAGGAGIAEHLHLHVVPRWVGDTNFIATVGAARVLPVALEELYDAVAPGFTGGEGHPIDLHGG